jgi:hypothetical protein
VTPCEGDGSSTTWCCGGRNTTCCGRAGAITVAATLGPPSTSSPASSTIYLSSTVVPTTSSTLLSSMSPTSTSNTTALSVGVEAGIGVGASLAALAILGGIIWFILRIRRRRRGYMGRGDPYFQRPGLDTNTRHGWAGGEMTRVKEPRLRHELNGEMEPSELSAS